MQRKTRINTSTVISAHANHNLHPRPNSCREVGESAPPKVFCQCLTQHLPARSARDFTAENRRALTSLRLPRRILSLPRVELLKTVGSSPIAEATIRCTSSFERVVRGSEWWSATSAGKEYLGGREVEVHSRHRRRSQFHERLIDRNAHEPVEKRESPRKFSSAGKPGEES